jgi:succinate dehydrogenase/fumarate reductase flavoprotein subunit
MASGEYSSARAFPARRVSRWDEDTDVIIVGFGAAGGSAAIEAAGAGAKVTLFEVGAGSGGATALSGGEIYLGGGGGTPIQRQNGFTDDTESLYTYLKMAGGPDADLAKVRLYADNSLAHYHWLVEQGVPYKGTHIPGKIIEPETDDTLIWCGSEEAWPFVEAARPAPRGHVIQWMGWGGGRKLMDVLEARARALGVDVRPNTRVLCLVADEDGAVQGVVIRADGAEKFVRARKGVILCTGGFCMNRDMLQRYAPNVLVSNDPIGVVDDGSGILMGESVGGDAIHMDQFFTTCPWYPPENLVKGIMVNIHGQRFINEDCYHGRVSAYIAKQPRSKAYLLLDNDIFDRPMEFARVDVAASGETWAEVESELGMTPGTLTATVEVFNREAAQGRDPVLRKAAKWLKPLTTGPFAALEMDMSTSFFSYFTLGGLNTLPTGEVLARDGKTVRGLYAAGRATAGLPRWGEGYSSGMSLADCTFFGRMAGKAVGSSAAK